MKETPELAEKARRTFAGKVRRRNFSDRCRANGLAARETDRTFAISARRRTAACIYMQGLGRWKNYGFLDYFNFAN